jgi:hypothetical protein
MNMSVTHLSNHEMTWTHEVRPESIMQTENICWRITEMTNSNEPGFGIGIPSPAFICEHCHNTIPGEAPGTAHRNHCPHCLWSLHVDLKIGDRRSGCRGPMEPIAVQVQNNGEWALIHRCRRCGLIRTNRIAGDDNAYLLLSMAMRPLARPPFPLDRIDELTTLRQETEGGH